MRTVLVVIKAFGKWKRGDVISDPTEINQIMGSENMLRVVRVTESAVGV